MEEDFLARRPVFFTNVTRKRIVQKLIWRLELDRLYEGYKQVIDKILGPMAKKKNFMAENEILDPMKNSLLKAMNG